VSSPLVTVITPVHNGEEHLQECIESVLRQTFQDWQYVIVDNASSDATAAIAGRFARADPRVRHLRHDDFVDVVQSYNRSIAELDPASSYCKVVGADDWLYPECLERMVALAEENPSVGIVGAYRLNDTVVDLDGLPYWRDVVPGVEILRQSLLGGPFVTGSATSILLRTELVRRRRPFYDPTFRHADSDADLWAFTQSDFGMVHQVLTFARRPPAAETTLSDRLNTYAPEGVRLVIRYGPLCLSPSEYRRRLRFVLRLWVRLHVARSIKPSTWADGDFYEFHRRAADRILEDAPDDREVRWAVALVRRLLSCRRRRL
jgi:glycosyltransferase involved in cell wall biosynthesis